MRYTKPNVKFTGNYFDLMGNAAKALDNVGQNSRANEMVNKIFRDDNCNNAKILEYVKKYVIVDGM